MGNFPDRGREVMHAGTVFHKKQRYQDTKRLSEDYLLFWHGKFHDLSSDEDTYLFLRTISIE